MKHRFNLLLALTWLALAGPAGAQVVWDVNQPVPDGTGNGLADTRTLNLGDTPIRSVRVELSVSPVVPGGWTGDLYVYLQHGDDLAILLNRPGRRDGNDAGYGDGGAFTVTLDDAAAHDIHDYRLPRTGSHTTPLPGRLTGEWQPDGRAVDPEAVRSSTPRTAGLDVFAGANPSGDWTLFIADVAQGGTVKLDYWSLELTLVPEPAAAAGLMAAGLLAAAAWRAARRIPRAHQGLASAHGRTGI